MPDIVDLFPHHNNPVPELLQGLTRENAVRRLPRIHCPLCNNLGQYFLFDKHYQVGEVDHFHVGIRCLGCQREHVFRRYGIMWLPGEVRP